MPVSKVIRFEVFKRDGFTCAYCGRTPPLVMLEVDHIQPKSKKGKDDINNLITSCFDCNRGKRDHTLDKAPPQLSENLEVLKEKEAQLKEYQKLIRKIERRINKEIDEIESVFSSYYQRGFKDTFKMRSLKRFLQHLTKQRIIENIGLAVGKFGESEKQDVAEHAVKYFCGICWNQIKGVGYGKD